MSDEEDEVLRWEPEPGEDIKVWTAEFCDLFGGCEKRPVWTTVAELRKHIEVPEAVVGDQTVFCVHWCHKVAPKV